MFVAPNKLKFKKFHRIVIFKKHKERKFFCPKLSDFALQARTFGKLTAKQIESARRVIRRFSKKRLTLKINIFPSVSITKKPLAARMGKGKGKPYLWVSPIKRGKIMFELYSLNLDMKTSSLAKIFKLVNRKLPVKVGPVCLQY